MINCTEAIIPGQGAGGVRLGADIRETLQQGNFFEIEQQAALGTDVLQIYRSANLDLWTKNNIIWQIMVHGDYEGKISGKIGIGSTLADVKRDLGALKIDMDEILVKGLQGVSFEPEVDNDNSPIVEIYIFEPDWTQMI